MIYTLTDMGGRVVERGTVLSRPMLTNRVMQVFPGSRGAAGIGDTANTYGLIMNWGAELLGHWRIEGSEEVAIDD
ncbi:hypothetical protein L5G28_07655 [Gordonia sp. HY285]|uniref:hypothetical protein n=1 Tax=Gordonia liuliyuniae TaxID=2911517 RepID=UPI001F31538B|nr:hypothetical protein [Gordonia liuliyuniae]MCF8610036.1 hypothetical protein [Gordonia liuliyuniae]